MKRRSTEQGGPDPKRPHTQPAKIPNTSEPSPGSIPQDGQKGGVEAEHGEDSSTATSTSSSGNGTKDAPESAVAGNSNDKVPAQARESSPDWVVSPSGSGSHFPQHFIQRLQNFFAFSEAETKRFYIDKLPTTMKWGTGEWSRFMCDAGQPVLMWLVCELSKEFFLCAPGCNPAKTISASVGMLREGDLQCAQRLLRENQRYNEPENSKKKETELVRLSQKTSGLTRTKQTVTWLFEDIFDARKEYDRKDAMARMRPDELGSGDVILAECYLTRYHCDAEGKTVYERPFETLPWNRWRTGFEIKYLNVLRSGEDVRPTAMPTVDDSHTKRM